MTRLEVVLIVIIAFMVLIWMATLTYLLVGIYSKVKNKSDQSIGDVSSNGLPKDLNVSSAFQTDFFNKSSEHAIKVLFSKSFDPQYGEANYYGNKLIDTIGKLNDQSKGSVVTAIKYLSVEPSQARANEQMMRAMGEAERTPLWFIILRESVKKVAPEFMGEEKPSNTNNVVSIFKMTG